LVPALRACIADIDFPTMRGRNHSIAGAFTKSGVAYDSKYVFG
jgi:hypothetical protein